MSQQDSYISAKFLPQLPGYRPHEINNAITRPQIFQRVKGESFVKDNASVSGSHVDGSLEESSILSIGTLSRPGTSHKKNDVVLTFQAYYDEAAIGSGPLVRQNVYIYLFLEDSSIKIVVAPKAKGGNKSGTKLRRCIVPKPDGSPIGADDFQLGECIVIYGRSYTIIDCNSTNR